MSRVLLLVLGIGLVACSTAPVGTYEAVTVNGNALPATFDFFGTGTMISGELVLNSDNTWSGYLTSRDSTGAEMTDKYFGTFAVSDDIVIFTPEEGSNDTEPFECQLARNDQMVLKVSDDFTIVYQRK